VPVGDPDKTKAGIFVLVWFETLNYAFANNDADPLPRSVGPGCFACTNWISEVQTNADKQQTQQGGALHVRDLAFRGEDNDDFLFRAVLNRDPGTLADTDGTTTSIANGSTDSGGDQPPFHRPWATGEELEARRGHDEHIVLCFLALCGGTRERLTAVR